MGDEISLGSLMQDMDVDKVDGFLKTISKYEKIFDKVSAMFTKLDKMGVVPAIIRVAGNKANIPDIDKPLNNPLSIQATTGTHMMFFKELNAIPENVISEMYQQMLLAAAKAKAKDKDKMPEQEAKVVS